MHFSNQTHCAPSLAAHCAAAAAAWADAPALRRLRQAREAGRLTSTEHIVLAAIVGAPGPGEGAHDVTLDRIATLAGCSTRTAHRVIARLEARGLLTRQRTTGATGGPNRYRVLPAAIEAP